MKEEEKSKVRITKIPQRALNASVFEVLKFDTIWSKKNHQK